MTDKPQKPEQYCTESLKVGDIELYSNSTPMKDLCCLMIILLKDKTVQKYLGFVNKKKSIGGFVG